MKPPQGCFAYHSLKNFPADGCNLFVDRSEHWSDRKPGYLSGRSCQEISDVLFKNDSSRHFGP